MKDLQAFVDRWEKTGDIESFLESGSAFPDTETVQEFLSVLPADQAETMRASFERMLIALTIHLEGMESEAQSLKLQIEQATQAKNACFSYAKPPR